MTTKNEVLYRLASELEHEAERMLDASRPVYGCSKCGFLLPNPPPETPGWTCPNCRGLPTRLDDATCELRAEVFREVADVVRRGAMKLAVCPKCDWRPT